MNRFSMLIAAVAVSLPCFATEYYVSPSGNNSDDGLSPATAWESIDNGDKKGFLVPGDTVNILVGTYLPTSTLLLTTTGTSDQPVTYRAFGSEIPVVDGGWQAQAIIAMSGDNAVLEGLEVIDSGQDAVHVYADSCRVSDCYIHDISSSAVTLEGSDNLVLRNCAVTTGGSAVLNEATGERNRFHHNTVVASAAKGIYISDGITSARLFNNIIASNDVGVYGWAGNVCAYNDVWGSTTADYMGGASDSAGGISEDPLFADPGAADFMPLYGAAVIDAGLDLGYAFFGDAPDMGAVETDYPPVVHYIEIDPQSQTVIEGASQQFNAYGYEADSSFVKDLTDSVDWSVTDPSGAVSSEGLYTAGHDLSPPDYHVVATYGTMVDSSTVTVVTDGTLSYIVVELGDGTPAPDTTLTTDVDTTRLFCRGYDSGDNLLSDQSVTWTLLGGESIGLISPSSGPSRYWSLRDQARAGLRRPSRSP